MLDALLVLLLSSIAVAPRTPPSPSQLNGRVRELMGAVDSASNCAALDDALGHLQAIGNFVGDAATRVVRSAESEAGWTTAHFDRMRGGLPRVMQVAAYNLARCRWKEGRLPEAATRFEQALSLMQKGRGDGADEIAEVHAQIGEVRSGLREWESAARHFAAASKVRPTNAVLLANLGAALLNAALADQAAAGSAVAAATRATARSGDAPSPTGSANAAAGAAQAYSRVIALRPADAKHAVRDRVQLAMALALVEPRAADPSSATAWDRSVELLNQTLAHLRHAQTAATLGATLGDGGGGDARRPTADGLATKVSPEETEAEARGALAANEEHTLLVFATLVLETSLRRIPSGSGGAGGVRSNATARRVAERTARLTAIMVHLERCVALETLAEVRSSAQQLASTVYRLGRVYRSLARPAAERALYARAVTELRIWRRSDQRPAFYVSIGEVPLIATPWWRPARNRNASAAVVEEEEEEELERACAGGTLGCGAEGSGGALESRNLTVGGGAAEVRLAHAALRDSPQLRAAIEALEGAFTEVRSEIAELLPSMLYEHGVGGGGPGSMGDGRGDSVDAEGATDLDDEGVADAGQWRKLVLVRDGSAVAPPASLQPLLTRLLAKHAHVTKSAAPPTPLEAWSLLMPRTSALLSRVLSECSPRLPRGSVEFSVLAPDSHLRSHCGPTNHRLRLHLPLAVPNSCDSEDAARCRTHAECVKCGVAHMRVGTPPRGVHSSVVATVESEGESVDSVVVAEGGAIEGAGGGNDDGSGGGVRSWVEGKVTVFDDSFEHEVWNPSARPRVVLLLDVWHPSLLAKASTAEEARERVRAHFWKNRS